MALSSIVRRGFGSVFPAAIRSVASRRAFHRELAVANSLSDSDDKPPAVVDPDETLVRVLKSEINWTEQLRHVESQVIPDGFPFEIKDNPGEERIFLTRKYRNELIRVEVYKRGIPRYGISNESNVRPRPQMLVNISKGDGPYVMYKVTAFPDGICFDESYINNPCSVSHGGPNFKYLNDNLLKAFHKYFEIRGISPSLANFLLDRVGTRTDTTDKYLLLLKTLKGFVEKEQLGTNTRSGGRLDEVERPFPSSFLFSTEKPTVDPDATLVRLLESEISMVIPDDFPYEISDEGDADYDYVWRPLLLKKKYGDEIIEVNVCWPDNHGYLKDKDKDKDKNKDNDNYNTVHESNQNDEPSFTMTVGVSKGDGPMILEFELAATRSKISICGFFMRNSKNQMQYYKGPNFDLLNDNLKMALYKYLEIREIKPGCSLTNFLLDHIRAEEYSTHRSLPWLKSLQQFVEK